MTTTFNQWSESIKGGLQPDGRACWDAGRQSAECDLTQFKEFSKLAARAMNDACMFLESIDGEDAAEDKKLCALRTMLDELVHQAFCLNGVVSLRQLGGEHE